MMELDDHLQEEEEFSKPQPQNETSDDQTADKSLDLPDVEKMVASNEGRCSFVIHLKFLRNQ